MLSSRAKRGIFYGWWIVLVLAIVHFYSSGTHTYGFTAFFNPIVEEFGWSYVLVSLAISFRGIEHGAMAPIVGVLADRFGPRRLLFGGSVVMGLGFLFFSRIHNLRDFYVVSLIIALGFSFSSGVTAMTAVAKWFKQRRTLAMGFLAAGPGAGGLLTPAVVWLVDQFTWRSALFVIGVGTLLLSIPLALVVKEPPREVHSTEKKVAASGLHQKSGGLSAKQILRTRDFWLISLAVMFGLSAGQAITAHQIPYMVSIGISRQTAGFLAIVFALANVAGRLGFGWLGDIVDARRCFVISVLAKTVGVLGFALATSAGQFVPALIILGIGFGGLAPLRPALQVEFFGVKAFGTIQGLLLLLGTFGGIVSPLFAGWMFDLGVGYRLAFLILAAATFAAVPTILAIRRKASNGSGTS